MRTDSHKLIYNGTVSRWPATEKWELYDLQADPKEVHTLIDVEDEMVQRMQRDLNEWTNACRTYAMALLGSQKRKTLTLDEKTKKELKALGYID